MKRTPWYPADTHPARRGWYERDHRQCPYPDRKERRISLDLWEPVDDTTDILYPGVWYVLCNPYWSENPITGERKWIAEPINDASHQNLPWRGLTKPAPKPAPYVRPGEKRASLTSVPDTGKPLF